jgi:hypothetical protein
MREPYAYSAPVGVTLACSNCGNSLTVLPGMDRVYCPACSSNYFVGHSGSAVYLQPAASGSQPAYPAIAAQVYPAASVQPGDGGLDVETSRQYLSALEKWNLFKDDFKLVKQYRGEEYARRYRNKQFLQRLACLVIMVPGGIFFATHSRSSLAIILLFVSFFLFDAAVMLMLARGIKLEIRDVRSRLEQPGARK